MSYITNGSKYTEILKAGKPENLTFSIIQKLCEFFPNEFCIYVERYGKLYDRKENIKEYNLQGWVIVLTFDKGELTNIKVK